MASLKLSGTEALAHGAFKVSLDGKESLSFLGGAKDGPHVNQLDPTLHQSPAFKGTPDEFLVANKNDKALQRQMKNKVRKCPQCSKAVAFTLNSCNSCSTDLSKVEISHTNNVFTGFIYGIEKGPFPFTVSMRYQDESLLVFDDLLALCPCHLNVIPSKVFIPDWRFLLKNPAEGRKLLDLLYGKTWEVVKKQFLQNEEWRKKTIRNSETYVQDLDQYARKVLDLNIKYDVNDDTPVEEITAFYKTKGVDYNAIHKECYARYGKSHELLANFSPKDFEYIVVENKKAFKLNDTKELPEATVDLKNLQNDDKTTLQNYGRPYADGKKPRGSYYAFPKKFPDDVTSW